MTCPMSRGSFGLFILCKLVENNWEIGDTLKQVFFVAFNVSSLTAEMFPSSVHIK